MTLGVMSVVPLERPCLHWILVLVEEPGFMRADWQFILISCIITIAILLASIIFSNIQVSIPLRCLQGAMLAITQLEFGHNLKNSMVLEIDCISSAYHKLQNGKLLYLATFQLVGISAMTKYVPQQLVREIMSNNAKLEMTPSFLTILFCDIEVVFPNFTCPTKNQNFSGISERNSKELVAVLLGKWFACFSELIMGSGGCIDKYIGYVSNILV